jgi:thiosulfate/3-mercaptopyruvate sulfurtransferase
MTTKFLGSFLAFASLSAAASRSDMLVSSDWLTQHLTDSKLVILHVSANRAVYDAGHIPGARFVALSELVVNRDGIPNEVPAIADLKKVLEAAACRTIPASLFTAILQCFPRLALTSRSTIWDMATKPRCSMAGWRNGAVKGVPLHGKQESQRRAASHPAPSRTLWCKWTT